jgi:hypothetical protein
LRKFVCNQCTAASSVGGGDAGGAGEPADEGVAGGVGQSGGVVATEKQRPVGAVAEVVLQGAQHDGREWFGGGAAAFAGDPQDLVAAVVGQ